MSWFSICEPFESDIEQEISDLAMLQASHKHISFMRFIIHNFINWRKSHLKKGLKPPQQREWLLLQLLSIL